MYALLLDKLEQQVSAERQVAAVFMAAGAKKVTLPTLDRARDDFDAALVEEPTVLDVEQQELLQVLGVRR